MPGDVFGVQFRQEGLGSPYPFADAATLVSSDGLALDRDLFLDAVLHPAGAAAPQALTAIVVAAGTVTLQVGDPAQPLRASAHFDPLAPPSSLAFVDPYGRPAGLLVADPTRLAAAAAWAPGTHPFPAGSADFVAACTIPTPQSGVLGILADGKLLTGDVWLVGEDGVVFSEQSDGSIRVDVVGDPLFQRRTCLPAGLFQTPSFVQTLSVVDDSGNRVTARPDAAGNINLTVLGLPEDTILRVAPVATDAVRISTAGQDLGTR